MSSKWTWVCALGCAAASGLASALAAADGDLVETSPAEANPYSVISDRNIFHLNPPPPPPSADDAKPPELSKVMLTGIMKKHDSLEVFLAIPPKDNKETTLYLSLAPGEKQHEVELVRVRYDKGEVDIINGGTPETLSVKSNSYASTAAAPAPRGEHGGVPGLPGFGHKAGFGPMRNTLPTPPGPTAGATPRGGSAIIAGGGSGGSAIISGGGGYGNGNAPSGGGAIVSGGSPYGAGALANTVGDQISSALLNQRASGTVPPGPVSAAPSVPVDVQAAQLMVHEAAGGPPMPPLPGER
jgi:hypothetical protein